MFATSTNGIGAPAPYGRDDIDPPLSIRSATCLYAAATSNSIPYAPVWLNTQNNIGGPATDTMRVESEIRLSRLMSCMIHWA